MSISTMLYRVVAVLGLIIAVSHETIASVDMFSPLETLDLSADTV